MAHTISTDNRLESHESTVQKNGFRDTAIRTVKWFCNELPADQIQASLEDLFSGAHDCSLLRCSVSTCEDDFGATGRGCLGPESGFCACETPFVTEYSETECSIAQFSVEVTSSDAMALRVYTELAVRCESGDVWKCILNAIGTSSMLKHVNVPDTENVQNHVSSTGLPKRPSNTSPVRLEQIAAEFVHAIRNPLGALMTATGLIKTSKLSQLSAEDAELLNVLESESARVEDIIRRLSDVCRTPQINPESVRAGDLIPTQEDDGSAESTRSRGEASVSYSGDWDIEIELDMKLMQSLLTTATRYWPVHIQAGEVSVNCENNESNVDFVIEYTGDNIRPEMLRKVLLPFNATKDGGSGLATKSVIGIVNAHSGRLAIDVSDSRCILVISLPRGMKVNISNNL